MKNMKSRAAGGMLAAALCFTSAASSLPVSAEVTELTTAGATETLEGITISADKISTNNYKNVKYNNPVSSEFFCADPTSIEYDGRLYLIGTNDHEQFEVKGSEVDNTYEQIKSLVILSTDDMVNWIYHGEINVGEVAPWITNSWAPTIVSKDDENGVTHFYIYFSNNGLGTGVIHSTDILGEWDDPLGKPLIDSSTPGLGDCPNPFDPGAVVDENGVGWLSFGAGKAADGTDMMRGSNRIVRLGEDMISLDSDIMEIPAPYHFEASELNYINGTYVYTYNIDWIQPGVEWPYDVACPSQCSMVYMTTKTPLDPESWEMRGEYFVNPGTAGFDYSNNHTHLHKFRGEYYIFYHTLMLKTGMGIKGAYRSMNVDKINVDEETVTIEKCGGTKNGPDSIITVDPFTANIAADLNNTADITFDTTDKTKPVVISDGEGSWFSVRDVEFTESAETEEEEPVVLDLTAIDTIEYHLDVKSVDKATTVSMHPASSDGENHTGSVEVTGTGKYDILCDIGGADGMMNMGYFTASDDALITFMLDSMTVNGKYEIDLSVELTNTREWADGLRNIWNGFADGDKVYTSDYAEFRYVGADDAIKLYAAAELPDPNTTGNAPLLAEPVSFIGNVKGTGRVEVRLDSPDGTVLTSIDFDSPDEFTPVYNSEVGSVGGTHDLYFVFSGSDIAIDSWKFAKTGSDEPTTPEATTEPATPEETTSPEETTAPEETTEAEDIVWGDINESGVVEVADAIAIMAYSANPEAYPLTDSQKNSADVYQHGDGVAVTDAVSIQKYLTKVISKLPESSME